MYVYIYAVFFHNAWIVTKAQRRPFDFCFELIYDLVNILDNDLVIDGYNGTQAKKNSQFRKQMQAHNAASGSNICRFSKLSQFDNPKCSTYGLFTNIAYII